MPLLCNMAIAVEYVVYAAVLVSASISTALGAHDLSNEYLFSNTLDGNGMYEVFWDFDLEAETISFAVKVKTTGWVGFGLSPNGQMPGSDVVIGWVDANGIVTFEDRYAEGRFLPSIDSSQDWFLVRGEEEEGTTVLEFTRNFTTCDDRDLNVELETNRLVWSWHSMDPTGANTILQHEFQGTTSLNLIGGSRRDTSYPNADSFLITNTNVTVPDDTDTTYWCSAFQLPEKVLQQERFIYKMSPVITEGNEPYVHHFAVYLCGSLNGLEIGPGMPCHDDVLFRFCAAVEILTFWGVGSEELVFPQDVGYPVGGPGSSSFIVMQVHYTNQELVSGIFDSSGYEYFYMESEPLHRAGNLIVARNSRAVMLIPPKVNNFPIHGTCASKCTQKFFPAEGLNIFASFLHTHTTGHGVTVEHYRQNEECGVIEELEPIDRNLKYDFNYQQINLLKTPVKVLPGDVLAVRCLYSTMDRTTITLGGESTAEEMCVAALLYYPRIDFFTCTDTSVLSTYAPFTTEYLSQSQLETFADGVENGNVTMVREAFEGFEWTPDAVQALESSVFTNSHVTSCSGALTELINDVVTYPDAQCSYEAPDKCAGTEPTPCCERLATGNGAYPTTTISASVLMVLTMMSISLPFY